MPQMFRPTKVVVVPSDGAIEITLNINITLDGQVSAMADNAKSVTVVNEDEVTPLIPDFTSGVNLKFGK